MFPQAQALEADPARPGAGPAARGAATPAATAEDFAGLDLDRRRAVVETVVEAVVVRRAEKRGAPWTPDRLEVVWS